MTVASAISPLANLFGRPEPLREYFAEDVTPETAALLGLKPRSKPAKLELDDGWPSLQQAALYGPAGNIVRMIGPHSEADPAALLFQSLAAIGNLLGPGLHCRVESTRHPLLLYPLLIGDTSKARKGTSWGHQKRLLAEVDGTWAKERITSGLSSGEGLIAEVHDDTEHTVDRRLLVVQSEFASVLRVMGRDGNTLSPILRQAWDGEDLRTLTKNSPLRAEGAHITVIGHTTRRELLRYLSDVEAHNGFANRLLFTAVRRSKFLPEGGSVPEPELKALAKHLCEVATWAKKRENHEMKRDNEARSLWAHVYRDLSKGWPGLLGAATSRAEAQVLRMSAIYAALDMSDTIRVEHLEAALAAWDYAFASAKFIFGDATGDPIADRIREALIAAGDNGMTRTEISALLTRHTPSERIGQALAMLAELGMAEQTFTGTDGRPIERWTAKQAKKAN